MPYEMWCILTFVVIILAMCFKVAIDWYYDNRDKDL